MTIGTDKKILGGKFIFPSGVVIINGSGSPESIEVASVGSLYLDNTNGDLYKKETGTSNTGWVILGSGGATNLSEGTRTTTTVDVNSDTGTNATLNESTSTLAGQMSADSHVKLQSIFHAPVSVTIDVNNDFFATTPSQVKRDCYFLTQSTQQGATGDITLYLPENAPIGAQVEFRQNFEATNSPVIAVHPNEQATSNIVNTPWDADGDIIEFNWRGGVVGLTRISASQWYVYKAVGVNQDASRVDYVPSGDLSSTDVQAAIDELDDEKSSNTLLGVSSGANDLGTFTGTIISDNTTVKNALQELETDTETNNAKVTNATHTGEVTGSGALTLDPTAISNKTLDVALTGTEEVLINDGGLKKTTTQAIADLGGGGGATSSRPNAKARLLSTASSGAAFHITHIVEDNIVVTRGEGVHGALGNGTLTTNLTYANAAFPTSFASETIVKHVSSNYSNMVLTATGEVWVWGRNNTGQLGLGTTGTQNIPAPLQFFIDNTITITDILFSRGSQEATTALDQISSYFLDSNGNIYGCGDNGSGQLGLGDTTQRQTPVQIAIGTTFTKIEANYNELTSFFAIDTSGNLWSAGYNGTGQLGQGSTTAFTTLTQVSGLPATVADVVACSERNNAGSGLYAWTLIKLTTGAVMSCGYNGNGQLGIGSTTQQTTFQDVTTLGTDNDKIFGADGLYGVGACIKNDGSVRMWGYNTRGILGDNTTTNKTSPITPNVLPATGAQKIIFCGDRSFMSAHILYSDGTVYSSGVGTDGRRGIGSTTQINEPTLMLTGSYTITDLASYGFYNIAGICMLTSDGNVLQCGNGASGRGETAADMQVPTIYRL
jgi:alpha-tubulin suppressor-like RCC1 family protein